MSGPRIVACDADEEQMLIDMLTGWCVELTLTPLHVIDIRVDGWKIGPDDFTWIQGNVWRPSEATGTYNEHEYFACNWGELEQVRIL